jgi:hypothetical protein
MIKSEYTIKNMKGMISIVGQYLKMENRLLQVNLEIKLLIF